MTRDKKFHHKKIIEAAKEEFLEYGFKDASMRRIAVNAGMSVSGLYKHFDSKEDMFSALVEPVYQGFIHIYCQEEDVQWQHVSNGDIHIWEKGRDAAIAVSYIYDNLNAFQLIICKAQGTKFENFLHELAIMEEKSVLRFMGLLKKQGRKINDFDKKELHLLITANINAVFQTVEHNFSREDAMHYADTLDRFFSAAWREFFGY